MRFGFGVGGLERSVPVYTAILLTGLTPTTFPELSTPIDMIPFEITGEALVRRENLSPESLAIPESMTNLVVRLVPVPIPIFVPSSNI